jgi:hypothetical protein
MREESPGFSRMQGQSKQKAYQHLAATFPRERFLQHELGSTSQPVESASHLARASVSTWLHRRRYGGGRGHRTGYSGQWDFEMACAAADHHDVDLHGGP